MPTKKTEAATAEVGGPVLAQATVLADPYVTQSAHLDVESELEDDAFAEEVADITSDRVETLKEIAQKHGLSEKAFNAISAMSEDAALELLYDEDEDAENWKAKREFPEFDVRKISQAVRTHGAQLAAMHEGLLPKDKRRTHTILWDPPAPDGLIYGKSVVSKKAARKKVKEYGFALRVDPAKLAANVHSTPLRCGLTTNQGVVCDKPFPDTQGGRVNRLAHREAKHPAELKNTQYEEQRAAAAAQVARDERNLAIQQRQMQLQEAALKAQGVEVPSA